MMSKSLKIGAAILGTFLAVSAVAGAVDTPKTVDSPKKVAKPHSRGKIPARHNAGRPHHA